MGSEEDKTGSEGKVRVALGIRRTKICLHLLFSENLKD
jgi:hypothetical protein